MTGLKELLPKGRNAWMLIGGGLAVVVLGLGLGMGPIRKAFERMDTAIVEKEKALGDNLRILAPVAREGVEKEYSRYGSLIRKQGSSEEEASRMLSEVDKLARETDVVLVNTKPLEPRPSLESEVYAVEIELEAGMESLTKFVYAVETSSQLLRVDQLAMSVKEGKTPGFLAGTIKISKMVTL